MKSKKATAPRKSDAAVAVHEERLQKFLASAGLGSRRECETMILEGRVDVDREVVSELGAKVDPKRQKVRVDGMPVTVGRRQYYIVNKPTGFVSTNSDPAGRSRVIDLVDSTQRVYSVGRLDKSSEGLMLLTNDGDLADRLTHPRYGVEKVYHVQVNGRPSHDVLNDLQRGVYLAEGLAKVKRIKVKKRLKNVTELEMVLDEGRNREIRRLLAKTGHKVTKLKRVAIGPVRLGGLPVGAQRQLTSAEVAALKNAIVKKKVDKPDPMAETRVAHATSRGNRGLKKKKFAARKGAKTSGSRKGTTADRQSRTSASRSSTSRRSSTGRGSSTRSAAGHSAAGHSATSRTSTAGGRKRQSKSGPAGKKRR